MTPGQMLMEILAIRHDELLSMEKYGPFVVQIDKLEVPDGDEAMKQNNDGR